MESALDILKNDLDNLCKLGTELYFSMLKEQKLLDQEALKAAEKEKKLPTFKFSYQKWYSESLRVIKQIIPDRTDDFIKQYSEEKRKDITPINYNIYDYLLGVVITKGE